MILGLAFPGSFYAPYSSMNISLSQTSDAQLTFLILIFHCPFVLVTIFRLNHLIKLYLIVDTQLLGLLHQWIRVAWYYKTLGKLSLNCFIVCHLLLLFNSFMTDCPKFMLSTLYLFEFSIWINKSIEIVIILRIYYFYDELKPVIGLPFTLTDFMLVEGSL